MKPSAAYMSSIEPDYSLQKLVCISLKKGNSPSIFVSLFHQLEKKIRIDDDDYINNLLDLGNVKEYPKLMVLKTSYALALSMASKRQSEKFWNLMQSVPSDYQLKYLAQLQKIILNKQLEIYCKREMLEVVFNLVFGFISSIVDASLSKLNEKYTDILDHIVLTWNFLLLYFENYVQLESLSKLVTKIDSALKRYSLSGTLRYFWSVSSKIQMNSLNLEPSVPDANEAKLRFLHTPSRNSLPDTVTNRRSLHINTLKRYLWLRERMKNWSFNEESFVSSFETAFVSKTASPVQRMQLIVFDLIVSVFAGFATAIRANSPDYVLFNWNNYILSTFPKTLNKLKDDSQPYLREIQEEVVAKSENLEGIFLKAFQSLDQKVYKSINLYLENYLKNESIYQVFVKLCIREGVLDPKIYVQMFPSEGEYELELNKEFVTLENEDIRNELESKLLTINSEFTSLDESGLIRYVNGLPVRLVFSETKQKEFSEIFTNLIDNLTAEKNNEKLIRLLLSISNKVETLYFLSYNLRGGPELIVTKLMDYIDTDDFNVDDDDNFQETYSYFGIIILVIIRIIEAFNLDYSNLRIKDSYVMEYLNFYYYRLYDDFTYNALTMDENSSDMDMRTMTLMRDWINALFDDNNEGLSDDIIKSVSVKQIYKVIPIIYLQAFFAAASNRIDFKILYNGIDYLSQMFLIPCTLSIIKWLLTKINGSAEDCKFSLQVLAEIIKVNMRESEDLGSESFLTFQTILKICGESICDTLKCLHDWESSEAAKEIISKVTEYQKQERDVITDAAKELNFNKYDGLKEAILNYEKNPEASLIYISVFMDKQVDGFVDYLLDCIVSLQKSSLKNEELKIFIDLAVYIILLKTIHSETDRHFFLKQLLQGNQGKLECNTISDEFLPCKDFQVSKILQVSENENRDDLFDLISASSLTKDIAEFKQEKNEYNSGLYKLRIAESPSSNDSIKNALRDKFISEIKKFLI